MVSGTITRENPDEEFILMQSDYQESAAFPAGGHANSRVAYIPAGTPCSIAQDAQNLSYASMSCGNLSPQFAFINTHLDVQGGVSSQYHSQGAGDRRYSQRADIMPIFNTTHKLLFEEREPQITTCDGETFSTDKSSYKQHNDGDKFIKAVKYVNVQNRGANLRNFEYSEIGVPDLIVLPDSGDRTLGSSWSQTACLSPCPDEIQSSEVPRVTLLSSQTGDATTNNTDSNDRRKVLNRTNDVNKDRRSITNVRRSVSCQSVEDDKRPGQRMLTIPKSARRPIGYENGEVLYDKTTETNCQAKAFGGERNENYTAGRSMGACHRNAWYNTHNRWGEMCQTNGNGPKSFAQPQHVASLVPQAYMATGYREVGKKPTQYVSGTSGRVSPVKCETCGSAFPGFGSLWRHIYDSHLTTADKTKTSTKNQTHFMRSNREGFELYSWHNSCGCHISGLSFESIRQAPRHNRYAQIGDYRCKTRGKTFETVPSLNDPVFKLEGHGPETQCPHFDMICGRYGFKEQLASHMARFPHSSDVRDYSRTPHAMASDTLTHKANRNEQRPHCDKRFMYDTRVHAPIKNLAATTAFRCDVCGRALTSMEELRNHCSIHDEKKFDCARCGKKFRLQQTLLLHIRNQHMPHLKNSLLT